MGKKAAYKRIKKLAEQMPIIQTSAVIGSKVTGQELQERGISEVEGIKVKPSETYREKKAVPIPINHHRKMKDLYKKYGTQGVQAYAQQVNRFIARRAIEEAKKPTDDATK